MARWTISESVLSPAQMSELERALAASGAFEPAPDGLRLASEEFYWIAALCQNGRFFFNAWRYPSPRYAALRFPEVLLRYDETGIPVNRPREISYLERRGSPIQAGDPTPRFQLQVGENGLRGLVTPF